MLYKMRIQGDIVVISSHKKSHLNAIRIALLISTPVRLPLTVGIQIRVRLPFGAAAYTSSSCSRLPTTAAAFCGVCSVAEVWFGSSGRSSWARLVAIRLAMAVLVMPPVCTACSICQAVTAFSACAWISL